MLCYGGAQPQRQVVLRAGLMKAIVFALTARSPETGTMAVATSSQEQQRQQRTG